MTENKQEKGNRERATGNRIRDYKDLKVWQKAIDVAEQCYRLTKYFPKDEIYALTNQIRRSAVSISSNIALWLWTQKYRRIYQIFKHSSGKL